MAAEMSVIGSPPTNGAAVTPAIPPFPSGPWHWAHFSAYMWAPWAGVPAPGGKPVPSGSMLISHAAMAAASAGLPRSSTSAEAAPAVTEKASQTAAISLLRVNMLDLPGAFDAPAGDRVEMVVQHHRDRRDRLQLPALGDKLGAGRLHVANLVPGAALQSCGAPVPAPGHTKAGERLTQHRLLQCSLCPAAPAIGRKHDFCDPAGAGVCDSGDFVEPGLLQGQTRRGLSDERLDLLQQIELVRLAVRQNRRIGFGFPKAHGRLLHEFEAPQIF